MTGAGLGMSTWQMTTLTLFPHQQAHDMMPGFNDAALKIRRADVLAHDASDGAAVAAASSCYVVNHYEALISPADYKVYTDNDLTETLARPVS